MKNNNNFIQISFEDFVKYIINKEPLDKTKENYNYLKPFLLLNTCMLCML